MYRLSLDGGTVSMWVAEFAVGVVLLSIAWACFPQARIQARRWRLLVGMVPLVGALFIFAHTRWSPDAHHRYQIAHSVELGEEVFRRYQAYQAVHGRYPGSLAEVYFPALDYFHTVEGVHEDPARCDGAGVGCRTLYVRVDVDGLMVRPSDELITCGITNLQRDWGCRDMR